MYQAGPFNPGRDAVTDKTVWWDNNKAIRRKRSMCCMPTCSPKPRAWSFTPRIFMAAPDGSSLYVSALTASKLAWAA